MKNKKSLLISLIVLASIGAIGMFHISQQSWLGAQIFQTETPGEIEFFPVEQLPSSTFQYEGNGPLDIAVHHTTPLAPEFINPLNIYYGGRSELEISEANKHRVLGELGKKQLTHLPELMSYTERLSERGDFYADKVPVWPETTIMTYGTMMAYLFPNEPNPILYGKATGLIPQDARSLSYMHRAEFMEIIGKIFLKEGINAGEFLEENGLIESEEKWNTTTREGFLLLDGLRVLSDVVEMVERKQIQLSKIEFLKNQVSLPQGSLSMDDVVLKLLFRGFVDEYQQQEGSRRVIDRHEELFLEQTVGLRNKALTATNIAEARGHFYAVLGISEPAVYELPELQFVGQCRELHKKTYMGPVAVTGKNGSTTVCGKTMVHIPAYTFVINGFSFPEVDSLLKKRNEDHALIRTESLKSYLNTLIVSEAGEEMISIVYHPENLEKYFGEAFKLIFSNYLDQPEIALEKSYTDLGARIEIMPRAFSGDHYVRFQH